MWGENEVAVLDFWEMVDGSSVLITNRQADLPPWFELHPLEVSGSLARWMMRRLNEGYKPQEPIEGPNIWRAKGGDRIAWVGNERPGQPTIDGVLALLDCRDSALVLGDHPDGPLAFTNVKGDAEVVVKGRQAVRAERTLGPIRSFEPEWRLG